jgi:hypothetical protein
MGGDSDEAAGKGDETLGKLVKKDEPQKAG